jgi:hypothetical protein
VLDFALNWMNSPRLIDPATEDTKKRMAEERKQQDSQQQQEDQLRAEIRSFQ